MHVLIYSGVGSNLLLPGKLAPIKPNGYPMGNAKGVPDPGTNYAPDKARLSMWSKAAQHCRIGDMRRFFVCDSGWSFFSVDRKYGWYMGWRRGWNRETGKEDYGVDRNPKSHGSKNRRRGLALWRATDKRKLPHHVLTRNRMLGHQCCQTILVYRNVS
jgi:hypothetical protein